MSLRLRWSTVMLVGALLLVAMLAVFPGVAEAQGRASMDDTQGAHNDTDRSSALSVVGGATRTVVKSGDSLGSISQERLGPNASPQQVANEVDRIYWLNRNLIGGDLDLIFVGQELFLPPVTNRAREPVSSGLASGPASEQRATSVVKPTPTQAAKPTFKPIMLSPLPEVKDVSAVGWLPVEEPVLPSPTASFTKAARSVTSSAALLAIVRFFSNTYENWRQLLGLGGLILTLGIALLIIWKLPMKRKVEPPFTGWRTVEHYAEEQAFPDYRLDYENGWVLTQGWLQHTHSPGSPLAEGLTVNRLGTLVGELPTLQHITEEQPAPGTSRGVSQAAPKTEGFSERREEWEW